MLPQCDIVGERTWFRTLIAMTRARRIPLPSLTRRLEEVARNGRPVAAALRRLAPELAAQIETDATVRELRSLWGRTRNFDENAGTRIVDPSILSAIGDLAGVPMGGAGVHSGFMHTYGYLLSNLRTPYGTKRSRYTSAGLERGLGLPPGTLRPYPRGGTLLANLTWALGHLAFASGSAERRRVTRLRSAVAARLRDVVLPTPTETLIEAPVTGRDAPNIEIWTQLVPRIGDPGGRLLIYSIRHASTGSLGRHLLLTAFPIDRDAVAWLRELARSPEPIRLRYNAYDRALAGRGLDGVRTFRAG